MMISNEQTIKGDRTINEIPINKRIVIRLLLQTYKVSFMQIKLIVNLHFMPFINWYLMRVMFFTGSHQNLLIKPCSFLHVSCTIS